MWYLLLRVAGRLGRTGAMQTFRSLTILALSAPPMIAGLVIEALAGGWPQRLAAAGMVLGGATALAAPGPRVRRFGWAGAACAAALAALTAL
jgi:hypothetical protein